MLYDLFTYDVFKFKPRRKKQVNSEAQDFGHMFVKRKYTKRMNVL